MLCVKGRLAILLSASVSHLVRHGVVLEVVGGGECLPTPVHLALVRFLSCVLARVFLEVAACGELFAAVVVLAVKGVSTVDALVRLEAVECVEGLVTTALHTRVRFLPRVYSAVDLETVGRQKGLGAVVKVALVREFPFMALHVCFQVAH